MITLTFFFLLGASAEPKTAVEIAKKGEKIEPPVGRRKHSLAQHAVASGYLARVNAFDDDLGIPIYKYKLTERGEEYLDIYHSEYRREQTLMLQRAQ